MIKEYSLMELNGQVYRIDSNSKNYDSKLKEGEIEELGETEYQILTVEDNTVNGMQAMAVAPNKNNKLDTSNIIITFPGNLFNLNTIKILSLCTSLKQTNIENHIYTHTLQLYTSNVFSRHNL